MSVAFLHPQLLLLLLLLPVVRRLACRPGFTPSTLLRLAIPALAIVALARPQIGIAPPGADLILLVDRSASCGRAANDMLRELLPLVRKAAGADDRFAAVAFGDGAVVGQPFEGGGESVMPDGFDNASDLAAGLRLAAALRDPSRRGAVLCLSDGKYTGRNPLAGVGDEALSGLPFFYRRLGGGDLPDVAAGDIVAPGLVEPRSAWVVRYSLFANAPGRASYALLRNNAPVAGGEVELRRGENHFFVRDAADAEGLLEYTLGLAADNDAVPQNNRSSALVRVRGAPRILLVNGNGRAGFLGDCLAAGAMPVDAIAPAAFPRDAAALAPYRLVALENCRLSDFPGRSAEALAAAVEEGVCSLLVTGGPNSFGSGGYHRSPLDPLLPVEMELRNESRRGRLAVAIALDRSGSMAMAAGGGATKMDLANRGAAESIRLLGPGDEAAVVAVDSEAHGVLPLSEIPDAGGEEPAGRVLGIKAMGGGIYCLTALRAAAGELRASRLANRHIILFADASDAEEQEGCVEFARQLARERISLSVVALGEPDDSDAEFLRQLARAGDGEALFASHASGLPALFAQDVMRVARRGFMEESVAPRRREALVLLEPSGETPPSLDGYNISAPREGAVVFMDAADEFATPLLVTRNLGKSSVGAILFEVEGEFSGGFGRWRRAPELLAALARQLARGTDAPVAAAYSASRRGTARVEFEFSPETARRFRDAGGSVRWLGPGGVRLASPLIWTGPEEAGAELRPAVPGHYLPVAEWPEAGAALVAPAVTLPYSAEFAPYSEVDGLAVLRSLAAASTGGEAVDAKSAFLGARAFGRGMRDASGPVILLALLLFLLELSGRRLAWFG